MEYVHIVSIAVLVGAGLISAVLGLTCLLTLNSKADKSARETKKRNGTNALIIGLVIVLLFTPIIPLGNTLPYATFCLVTLIIFPVILIGGFVCLCIFISIGVKSLRAGYKRDSDGRLDSESITLGYFMIFLGIVIFVFSIITTIYSFSLLRISFFNSTHKDRSTSSASPGPSSISMMKDYLFSVIYK